MKDLERHIDAFEKLMTTKGFNGHFLCNASFPGKLRESLQQHLLNVLQGTSQIRPFYLSTYSNWTDEQSPYVLCDFKVRYDRTNGFIISKVEAQYKRHSSCNPIKSIELRPQDNKDVPTREAVNSAVVPEMKRTLKR